MAIMSGFGIKVKTDTGRWVWLTEAGTAVFRTAKGVLRYDSETGAEMDRDRLARQNPHAELIVKKFDTK